MFSVFRISFKGLPSKVLRCLTKPSCFPSFLFHVWWFALFILHSGISDPWFFPKVLALGLYKVNILPECDNFYPTKSVWGPCIAIFSIYIDLFLWFVFNTWFYFISQIFHYILCSHIFFSYSFNADIKIEHILSIYRKTKVNYNNNCYILNDVNNLHKNLYK